MPGSRERSWFGWGFVDEALAPDAVDALGAFAAAHLGGTPTATPPPVLREVSLPRPRVALPSSLAGIVRDDTLARVAHCYGKAYRDVARAFERRWENAPDLVAFPASEQQVIDLLDWAGSAEVAVVPYGGGSSVVGGVEADLSSTDRAERPAVSLDLTRLSGVVEVDDVSRAARIRAGTYGPDADAALAPHRLSMRHFPQSYEHSTVGGWLATRAGGHFATGPTHIDDLVESVRAVTPTGVWESRRLPSSGAGPSPDRLLVGSEGSLGVITETWLRVHARPRWRAAAPVHFSGVTGLHDAITAARFVAQSGLRPANCRVLDPTEAQTAGVSDGSSVLLLGFESADHPVEDALARALAIAADVGGTPRPRTPNGQDAAAGWRSAFLRAPYLRDAMVSLGVVAETFETACTWDDFQRLHAAITSAVTDALAQVCGGGQVGMRVTHVYPDGLAPYYTVLALGRPGSLVDQWDAVKAAAAEAIVDSGGTITHHHAVGRVHMPGYRVQRPAPFARALAAVKRELDPAGVLNPGVLVGG
ncbi:MAG: FAD-binding oxidoreductase [Jiangellales bacterium]